jgi:hypothetical protein
MSQIDSVTLGESATRALLEPEKTRALLEPEIKL